MGRYGNESLKIGSAAMQGFKSNMEDFYIIELNLSHHPHTGIFAIFDGHCGTTAARWFSENFCKALDKLPTFSSELIQNTIIELDEHYLKVTGNLTCGTTATFCIIEKINDRPDKSHKVTICNIGDSRIYIGKYGIPQFVLITQDHKPTTPTEKQRILAAGGTVTNSRVDGFLAVSRSLGDFCYKSDKSLAPHSQKIISVPDIHISYVGKDDYLFLCSDGILEPRRVRDGDWIFQFFNERLKTTTDTALILSDLMKELLQSGARDNMTAMLIEFKHGKDYNSGSEFVAGEYYEEYGNLSYLSAFRSNCEMNGKTLDEVRAMWYARKELERKREETDNKKSD